MKGHLVEIVLHALLTENRVSNHAAADISDVQAIGARLRENKIGGLATAAAVHVFVYKTRIARNIFLQEGNPRADAQVARSARRAAVNDRDRLALVERCLGIDGSSEQEQRDEGDIS